MFPLETKQAKGARYGKIAAVALPLLCLALPSLWLLTTVPPLWRDVDAYVQLTSPPNQNTILLHGPLYCELARVPLWLGHFATGGSVRFARFLKQPQLTDAGISILLLLQHAGFWLAAFYLIAGISSSLAVRVVLALFIASHPIFYGFAHCVGSETLSMILILLLAGIGLRIVAAFPAVPWHQWLLAGLVLFCAILTRHINAVLIGLFPLTILLLMVAREWRFWRERAVKVPGAPHWPKYLRVFGASLAVGLVAFFLSGGYVHLLCRKARIRRGRNSVSLFSGVLTS